MNPVITRKQSLGLIAAAVGLWLAGAVPCHAATVTAGDPTPNGIGYNWTVSMSGWDTTAGSTPNYAGTVGYLSFNDPVNDSNPIGRGWTHTSNWTALTLTEATDLTVTLAANGSGLLPAFALWQGQQNTDNGTVGGYHVYNNSGNFDWSTQDPGADSSSLNYVGNESNSGALSSVSKTFSLGPGLYSLVFGGAARDVPGAATGFLGYQATLTTTPVPAAVYLFGSGLIGLAGLARRKFSA
ncbi:MAG: hypothetical protein IPP12_09625 [Nitrospira sp.]|jgi:hypothetical protein|nr:hypothetical protein [Nitrospira sp.]